MDTQDTDQTHQSVQSTSTATRSPQQIEAEKQKWRVIAVLESGKPEQLGNTYPREKAETLRDAHRAVLNGDETAHVRPPANTERVRIMTIEEHEAKRLDWYLSNK